MSVAYVYSIKDDATPAIRRKIAQLTPQRLNEAVGNAEVVLFQNHFLSLPHNKKGWPTTNFYGRAARATNWQPHIEGTLIQVSQIGIRQRFKGGPITPDTKGALTIPISPVSYGHVAADFQGLFLLKTSKGAYLVQAGQRLTASGQFRKQDKSAGGNVKRRVQAALNFLFKLCAGVEQDPDPNVLPTREQILNTATQAITEATE